MRSLRLDHLVDQPVVHRLLGGEEEVSIAVLLHLLHRLVGELGDVGIDLRPNEQDLFGLDLDVRCLTSGSSQRLVDHDAGIRQRATLAFRACTCCTKSYF